jgi:hypothetical protein
MSTQPLGWFKKPITKSSDFKGLKFRTNGLAIDLFTAMGAAVNALPGGEIVPALDRGLLDAAEFNNPTSDTLLGFPDVSKDYMVQSYHQSAECFEIVFNKTKFDTLPTDLFFPVGTPVERNEMIALPDGLTGTFALTYKAQAQNGAPWLDQAERRVVTRIGALQRASSERWSLGPI